MHPLRTILSAPGNHPRKVEKVFAAGADAVILDLEDAVAIAEKPATRPVVAAALRRGRRCLGYVRVNAMTTQYCYGDLAAVVGPGLDGIVLPKGEAPWQLKAAGWLLGEIGGAGGAAAAPRRRASANTGRGGRARAAARGPFLPPPTRGARPPHPRRHGPHRRGERLSDGCVPSP